MEFIIASHNQKKIREMDAILGALGISFSPLPEGAPEPEETGTTFEENALIKAQAACQLTGKPAIADDSGLAVEALDGAPGIYSARYCEGSDADRNAFLLRNMEAVPDGSRQAKFVSAIACAFPNGDTLTVRGECPGEILRELHGEGGFGYDPLFWYDEAGCTFAELPAEQKNRVSHRARALQKMKQVLGEYYAEQ
ncbi:MAG: RdgB/HAM1 family non-canonical purine NTP pyrophosphatase [Clostridiaceae bacterium]|nr:RdgB/HAM1 family non-canonical purine NTP pyrophosphatase [Clostridiaceae bacterium]